MRYKLIEFRGRKTQEEVAKDINISQQYLSEIERGHKTPSIKLAKKFEDYYKCDIKILFPDIFLSTNTTKCGIDCVEKIS